MNKLISLLSGMLLPLTSLASPFLICDPYPSTGQQPTDFSVTISGITNPVISPSVDVTGGKSLKLDLGPLNLTGTRTVTVVARNQWGVSASSSPLVFTAGVPTSPAGITLSAH